MNWARQHARGLVDLKQLAALGWVQTSDFEALSKAQENLEIRVPAHCVEFIQNNETAVLRQFVPDVRETFFLPEELEDPIGDETYTPVEGVTHRYPDRVLLKPTYQCASYCRFCFRRYKVSDGEYRLEGEKLTTALQYIKNNTKIWEVILSGGDPLVLTDTKLAQICEGLSAIEHVKVLRVHTRIPSVLPERINSALISTLRCAKKQLWVVWHVNASVEMSSTSRVAIDALHHAGIGVLSQSVLLRGVNDSSEALEGLFKSLVEWGVKPYYLHYPDLARGTSHFRVPLSEALTLVGGLRGRLSGLCIPQFIVDIPGGHGKVVVEPQWSRQISASTWEFLSPTNGQWHRVEYQTSAVSRPVVE